MADQPPRRLPHHTLPNEDQVLHSLSEIETMRSKFVEELKAKGIRKEKTQVRKEEAVLDGVSSVGDDALFLDEDVYTSAPEEGGEAMEDMEDIDSEEEYRKEMEEQRLADRKNGHFSAKSEEDDEGLESRNQREVKRQANRRSHRNPLLVSPENGQILAMHRVAGVPARVAAYEARMPSRVAGGVCLTVAEDDGGKRKSVAAVSHKANLYLQQNESINTICLGNTENGGTVAVQEGENDLFTNFNPNGNHDGFVWKSHT